MEENKNTQANQAKQNVECTTCHKQVSNVIETKNGPICENCMKASSKRKYRAGGVIIGAIVVAILCGGYYYKSKSVRKGIGFNGIENVSDSMVVNVESEINTFNIASTTATSAPVLTQDPISNISDFEKIMDRNFSNAENTKADKVIIPAVSSLFAINTNCFVSGGENVIKAFADAYSKTNKQATILVEGYTCDLGSDQINTDLSKLRAEVAKHVLVNAGVPSDKIEVKWYGKTRFKEFSYKNKSEYRRVIVSIK